jgi:hypothetical protein
MELLLYVLHIWWWGTIFVKFHKVYVQLCMNWHDPESNSHDGLEVDQPDQIQLNYTGNETCGQTDRHKTIVSLLPVYFIIFTIRMYGNRMRIEGAVLIYSRVPKLGVAPVRFGLSVRPYARIDLRTYKSILIGLHFILENLRNNCQTTSVSVYIGQF